MSALTRKLLRDFARLWAQALAISLVLGCGVAVLLISFGMSRALDETRKAYYERNNFADVFASARRAPESLMPLITAIDGVYAAEARVVGNAVLDVEGNPRTVLARILSLPANGTARLNRPLLRSGRLPDPMADGEVAVNEAFAEANGFVPGSVISANLNGTKRPLTITGTVLSPEFIYTIGPGQMMPDNESYGILWMPHAAAAAAFDMSGAFNDISLKLSPRADTEDVMERLDSLLEPYGGLSAYDRSQQVSNAFIDAELEQLRATAVILPPVFFAISAFLVNMVIGRIVLLERSQIGLLKAIGYSNLEVCLSYIYLGVLIAVTGIVLGTAMGSWLARELAQLYARFFDFPYLIYNLTLETYAIAAMLGLATAVAGAVRSALSAAMLPPAVAMAPPAPPRFRRSVLDRLMAWLSLSQPTVMILRGILRWPLRSGMTILGLSLATSVLTAASFFDDALDEIIDTAFYQSNRQDAMLLMTDDIPEAALQSVAELPGVMQVEGQQFHSVILRHGQYMKRTSLEARAPDTDLSRIVDGEGNALDAPPGGIMLSERLAAQLRVVPGDEIEAEFLTGRRETHRLQVTDIVTQYLGLGAYMDLATINRLFRQAPQVSVVNVTLDEAQTDAFHARLKNLPNLAGTVMLTENRRAFSDTIKENVVIMATVYISIAVLITFGVAYNSARIQLSERARELASLRILGFSRAEVSYILVGETMLLAALAQVPGWILGTAIAKAITEGSSSDLYQVPLVIEPPTYAYATLITLAAALGSILLVRRRLDQLDIVAVMKTRE